MAKYSIWDRIYIRLFGSKFIEYKVIEKNGSKTTFREPIYAFDCPIHGIVENQPYGPNARLICLKCLEDKWKYA